MDNYDVVKKLIGKISPIGETNIDNEIFENLKATTELVCNLISDIKYVAAANKNRTEHSMKRCGEYASNFLKELGIY